MPSIFHIIFILALLMATPAGADDSKGKSEKEDAAEKAVQACKEKGLIGKRLDECVRQETSR